MRLFKQLAALALLLAAASPAFADIALPKKPDADNDETKRELPASRMTIERVEGLPEARLQIPRSRLREMGLVAGVEGAGGQSETFKTVGTVVGGVFISLAFVLTGLLLVRSRRGLRVGRSAAVVALCGVAAAAAAVGAYANAPAVGPGSSRPRPMRIVAPPLDPGTLGKAVTGAPLAGSIRVEVVEDGYEIKLLLPAKARNGRGDEEE